MNIGFIGRGLNDTISEQQTTAAKQSIETQQAWKNEVKVGKALRQALLEALDYNDVTEMLDNGTVYVLSSESDSKKNLVGLDWLFAKVAYKLYEKHSEVKFEWVRDNHPEVRLFYLSKMDKLIVYKDESFEDIADTVALVKYLNPNIDIINIKPVTNSVAVPVG